MAEMIVFFPLNHKDTHIVVAHFQRYCHQQQSLKVTQQVKDSVIFQLLATHVQMTGSW